MKRIDLKGMTRQEMESETERLGIEKFHGRQIFRWINREGATGFSEMTDISKELRRRLSEKAVIGRLGTLMRKDSADGTAKFLFGLYDGYRIESVLIPDKRRLTLCLSSQAGCALGCRFCATGTMGFNRNLTSGEIVDQFIQCQKLTPERITNIVFMGMGEPTLNLKNVLKACDIICDDYGPALSRKKITISTVGVIHALRRFVTSAGKLGLAISLHSADEEIRRRIMPAAAENSLDEIMIEAKRYTELWGRRVSFEYLLLADFNDSIADAKRLVRLVHGIPCKINLIRFNPFGNLPFKRPDEDAVLRFRDFLYPRTYAVNIRESRGLDICGACGQLAAPTPD